MTTRDGGRNDDECEIPEPELGCEGDVFAALIASAMPGCVVVDEGREASLVAAWRESEVMADGVRRILSGAAAVAGVSDRDMPTVTGHLSRDGAPEVIISGMSGGVLNRLLSVRQ
jgi:hypothetical protein